MKLTRASIVFGFWSDLCGENLFIGYDQYIEKEMSLITKFIDFGI